MTFDELKELTLLAFRCKNLVKVLKEREDSFLESSEISISREPERKEYVVMEIPANLIDDMLKATLVVYSERLLKADIDLKSLYGEESK